MRKAESRRIDAFELWCWRRLLRVPWTARRSNQPILKGMTITEFDFSDKSESSNWFAGTEIFDTQKTGPAISCLGGQTGYAYKKIDDEHDISLYNDKQLSLIA